MKCIVCDTKSYEGRKYKGRFICGDCLRGIAIKEFIKAGDKLKNKEDCANSH